jgi:exosortase/archaeosortase family protein
VSVSMNAPQPHGAALGPRRDRLNVPVAVAVFAGGLALLVWQAKFRVAEAAVSAWLLRVIRLRPASSLGGVVIFPLGHRWVGFSLSVACTAALLIAPFFAIAGLLLLFGRVDRRRAVGALAITSAIIFLVNQLRLMVIAASMLWWGFQTGYERSHILLGTALSTIGVIIGIVVFVWMLIDGPDRQLGGVTP